MKNKNICATLIIIGLIQSNFKFHWIIRGSTFLWGLWGGYFGLFIGTQDWATRLFRWGLGPLGFRIDSFVAYKSVSLYYRHLCNSCFITSSAFPERFYWLIAQKLIFWAHLNPNKGGLELEGFPLIVLSLEKCFTVL